MFSCFHAIFIQFWLLSSGKIASSTCNAFLVGPKSVYLPYSGSHVTSVNGTTLIFSVSLRYHGNSILKQERDSVPQTSLC